MVELLAGKPNDLADVVLDLEGVHLVWTHDDLTGPMADPLPLLIPHPALTHGRTDVDAVPEGNSLDDDSVSGE